MIKLVLSDLDGTLLNDRKEIPEKTFELIEKLSEKGILFGVATGRHKNDPLSRFEKVKDKMLFLTLNGGYVFIQDKVISKTALPSERIEGWIEEFSHKDEVYLILSGAKGCYMDCRNEEYLNSIKNYYRNFTNTPRWTKESAEDEIIQISFCNLNGVDLVYQKMRKYENEFQVKKSGPIWADLNCKGVNKGIAVKDIQNYLNITPEETLIFGDFYNDLEMMEFADKSVCMKNGCDDLKKICNYETVYTNNEEGVVRVLEELLKNNGEFENMHTVVERGKNE